MSKRKSERQECREFGLTVGIAFVVLAAILFWLKKPAYPYLFGVGFMLVLAGLAVPRLLNPLRKGWMGASTAIGWVMTNLILCIAFFLIVTPMGLVLRLSGKKLLDRDVDRSSATYWRRRETGEFDRSRCESQY